MTRLSSRVREVSAQRTLLALPNPFQRLCVQLLLLARRTNTGEVVIDPVPTHQELAIMIQLQSRDGNSGIPGHSSAPLREAVARDRLAVENRSAEISREHQEGRTPSPKA